LVSALLFDPIPSMQEYGVARFRFCDCHIAAKKRAEPEFSDAIGILVPYTSK
jgi:hypothetical protein